MLALKVPLSSIDERLKLLKGTWYKGARFGLEGAEKVVHRDLRCNPASGGYKEGSHLLFDCAYVSTTSLQRLRQLRPPLTDEHLPPRLMSLKPAQGKLCPLEGRCVKSRDVAYLAYDFLQVRARSGAFLEASDFRRQAAAC